ncbi:MAG TPA: non-homologous end-joining DNA ligase [Actinomycetospora sp.]|jgi:DNA ligase D-like protein (predicted polymerase)/DNA ligase D-like protein (predicted 3'-phosphoesterase)|uniref:non-homologous end-joining DNA ligase n=1 Tax=Actinomycetospora sp. TaxID=1872135 RepID=UPI002F3EC3F8
MGELGTYRAKRDPGRTPEPFGDVGARDTDAGGRFVVQEHHARRLHYDVRLERGGVLVCWAVPKGLPEKAGTPRLAVHTEDHPLEYLDFHGEIPKGEYGGGRMTVWDSGTYETEKWSDDEVAVTLHGEQVDGRFVFFRPARNDDHARTGSDDWLVTRRTDDGTTSGERSAGNVQSPRVAVGGRTLKLSNLDKELYPGTPKNAVIDYYARVADTLLPHLEGRPVTLRRFPDGIDGESFYEKNAGRNAPSWLRSVVVPTPGSSRGSSSASFLVVEELAALVYLANLAVLELHVPQWRVDAEDHPLPPDELVFDLDPGPGTGLLECAAVARRIRDRLAADGLVAGVKTSGSKGMQMTAPVSLGPDQDASATSEYAKRVAEALARETPKAVTAVMAKDRRQGKVFVDWSQNNTAKTTVAPYSLRARTAHGAPTVSTPLTWDEVEECTDPDELVFSPEDVLARIAEHGDLYAAALCEGSPVP